MSAKDVSAIIHNNEMEEMPEITFENHVNGTSSSNSTVVEDGLSSRECGRSENNLAEIVDVEDDFKNDGVKSIEWVQIDSDVAYVGKDTNNDFVSMPLQYDNGMEENPEMVFENHADDTSTSNFPRIVQDGVRLTGDCEDIENNNVDINIKDDLKSDGLNSRESELIENNVAHIEKGLDNDDCVKLDPGRDNKTEQIPGITFENFLVEDSTTSDSQATVEDAFSSEECGRTEIEDDLKNDDARSGEWVQIESNLAYIGKEVDDDSLKLQVRNDSEVEKTMAKAIESHVDGTSASNSQEVEDDLNSRKCESVEITLPDINVHDDLKNDDLNSSECVHLENGLADKNNGQNVKNDGLSSTEGELIERHTVNFGKDTNNSVLNMQLQHQREMQELQTTLQDEYQKQVNFTAST